MVAEQDTIQVKLIADTRDYVKNYQAAEVAVRKQTRALEGRAVELKRQIQAERAAGTVNKERVAQLEREYRATRSSIAQIKLKANAFRDEAKAAKVAATETKAVEKAALGVGSAFKAALGPILSVTAALAGVSGALTTFASFERTLNTIKAVSGATAADMKAIEQQVLALGQSTIFTSQQVAEAFLIVSKAGLNAQQSIEAMPGLLNLAAAAGGDLSLASDLVANNIRALGLSFAETGELADQIAAISTRSAAGINDIGDALKYISPLVRANSVELAEMSTVLSVMANNSIRGEMAGTAYRNMLLNLNSTSKQTRTALKQLGVEVVDTATGKMRPLLEIVKDMQGAFANLSEAQRPLVAELLVGKRAISSFLALINTAPAELDKMVNGFRDVDGAAEEMAGTINSGLSKSIAVFQANSEALAISIGRDLSPAFASLLGAVSSALRVLANDKPLRDFIGGAIAGTTAVIGFAGSIRLLQGVAAGLAPVFAGAAAALGMSAGAFTAVVLAAGVAVGGLAVHLGNLTERAEDARRSILDVRQEVDNLAAATANAQRPAFKLAKEYDELSKKKALTKDESIKLRDIQVELSSKFNKTSQELEEMTRKLGSATAAVRELALAETAAARAGELRTNLVATQAERKQANRKVKALENQLNSQKMRGVNPIAIAETEAKLQAARNSAMLFAGKEESLKNTIKSNESAIQRLLDEALNPAPPPPGIPDPDQFDTLNLDSGRKTADKTGQIQQHQLRMSMVALRNQEQANQNNMARAMAELGPFPTQIQADAMRQQAINNSIANLERAISEIVRLPATKPESIEAKNQALTDLALQLDSMKTAMIEAGNEQVRFNERINQTTRDLEDQRETLLSENDLNRFKDQSEQIANDLKQQYETGRINAKELEIELNNLAYERYTRESDFLDLQEVQARMRLQSLNAQQRESGEHLKIQNELEKIEAKRVDLAREYGQVQQENRRALEEEARFLGATFAMGIENAFFQAFQSITQGGRLTDILRNFAGSLASTITNVVSGVFSDRIKDMMGTFAKTFQQSGGGIRGVMTAITQFGNTTTGRIVAGLGVAGSAIGGFQTAQQNGMAAGMIAGGLGGALSGFMGGGPIGAVVGGAIGALGGLFGRPNQAEIRRQQEIERAQRQSQGFLLASQNIAQGISLADPNNLLDLQARQSQVIADLWAQQAAVNIAARSAPKGSAQRPYQRAGREIEALIAQTQQQFQQLIAARQKSINEAIRELRFQNAMLEKELEIRANPHKAAILEQQLAIMALKHETKKALEQFKDSQQARTLILQQESLKRQQIEKQTQEFYENSAKSLEDLLKRRDEIENMNVFTRAKSLEDLKAEQLQAIDKDIFDALKEFNTLVGSGIPPLDIQGFNRYKEYAAEVVTHNNQLEININGAKDPDFIREEVLRAITAFYYKNAGVNVV